MMHKGIIVNDFFKILRIKTEINTEHIVRLILRTYCKLKLVKIPCAR